MKDQKSTGQISKGAFIVSRTVFESELWKNKPAAWWKIWTYILGNVQHKPYKSLKRGQGYFNFTKLCEKKAIGCDVTVNKIESFIKYAKRSNIIKASKATHGIFITICNYNLYQELSNYSDKPTGTRMEQNQPRPEQNSFSAGTELASMSRLDENLQPEQNLFSTGNINNNEYKNDVERKERLTTMAHKAPLADSAQSCKEIPGRNVGSAYVKIKKIKNSVRSPRANSSLDEAKMYFVKLKELRPRLNLLIGKDGNLYIYKNGEPELLKYPKKYLESIDDEDAKKEKNKVCQAELKTYRAQISSYNPNLKIRIRKNKLERYLRVEKVWGAINNPRAYLDAVMTEDANNEVRAEQISNGEDFSIPPEHSTQDDTDEYSSFMSIKQSVQLC